MSRCRQYVSVEILSFLRNTAKPIRDMQKRRSEDRLGHFGQFVMFELRAKLQALHDTFTCMTNVLFSDFEIEVACAEWGSSAMKCEMCFPLKSHKVQRFALRSSGKRVSARVSLALVPDVSNYAVFIAIHDAYYGFGSAITDYSYTHRQPMARKYDLILD